MPHPTLTAEEARSGAAAAGFDSLESAFLAFINQAQAHSLWQSFLSSTRPAREAKLRSRFRAAGLWGDWAGGGDGLARALGDFLPADLWVRHGICPPQRAIMLAATSKRIRGLLAQLQRKVPARVQVTRVEGLDMGLPRMLTLLGITALEVQRLNLGDEGAGRLAGVLGQCGALAHLDLEFNDIGADGVSVLCASWRGSPSGLLGVRRSCI